PDVHVVGTALTRKFNFVAERGYIFSHNGFNRSDLFKVSVADTGFNISCHPQVRDADAVILSWINQGMLSLHDIKRLVSTGKALAWVMHDMWCMTGACHHAQDCGRYIEHCGNCQYFYEGKRRYDLSYRGICRKRQLYEAAPGLKMIAVSSWLRDRAKESSLLAEREVYLVPNAFPAQDFYTEPSGLPVPAGIDSEKKLIIMGAARLDDPIKNFPLAISSLNGLVELEPELADKCQAIFFGDLRDKTLLDQLKMSYVHLGPLNDRRVIIELYARSAVVLSTSLFETLPGTIIEGMAAGCTPVATGNGGQRDILDDGVTGYLVNSDSYEIANALRKSLSQPFDRVIQHQVIEKRFSAEVIARSFLNLLS
ncbi:MAG: glycosyltransferase, partial [Muribaculaceae bacterium]|nr:glycosyltransferase [Muribaculaceae bacterium]